jgi:hypothetical protein
MVDLWINVLVSLSKKEERKQIALAMVNTLMWDVGVFASELRGLRRV